MFLTEVVRHVAMSHRVAAERAGYSTEQMNQIRLAQYDIADAERSLRHAQERLKFVLGSGQWYPPPNCECMMCREYRQS